jgi:conjugative transfer signal peptidase TraF
MVGWLLGSALLGTLLASYVAGLRFNTTASMPIGIWWTRAAPFTGIGRGTVVTYCLPPERAKVRIAVQRGYLGKGICPGGIEPLLKPVVALPGDVVTVTAEGVAVNGVAIPGSAPLDHDTAERPLHRMSPGRYPVGAGETWLLSSHDPRSWDSRYLGPLPLAGVQSVAAPLLVSE